MTTIKKLTIQLTLMALVGASVLFAVPQSAEAIFSDIPTVDEGEVDRLEELGEGGIDSEGCNDLKGEIGDARNAMQRYFSDFLAASTLQEAREAATNLRNGSRWIRIATTIYETNCMYIPFGGGPGDGGGPAF